MKYLEDAYAQELLKLDQSEMLRRINNFLADLLACTNGCSAHDVLMKIKIAAFEALVEYNQKENE